MDKKLKAREDRVRRSLAKRGYRLSKTPSRSGLRKKFGVGYQVTKRRSIVLGFGARPYMARLERIERFARRLLLRPRR